jgi:hypothetical protein
VSAGAQLLRGVQPIFVGRSMRTASGLPQFISEGRDVGMSECGDAMSIYGRRPSIMLHVGRVLESLP